MSFYKEYLRTKKLFTYLYVRSWDKDENDSHVDNCINGKRISRFSNLQSRVFDRNMVDGYCYGNFYGIDKIKYARKDYEMLKKRKFKRILANSLTK